MGALYIVRQGEGVPAKIKPAADALKTDLIQGQPGNVVRVNQIWLGTLENNRVTVSWNARATPIGGEVPVRVCPAAAGPTQCGSVCRGRKQTHAQRDNSDPRQK